MAQADWLSRWTENTATKQTPGPLRALHPAGWRGDNVHSENVVCKGGKAVGQQEAWRGMCVCGGVSVGGCCMSVCVRYVYGVCGVCVWSVCGVCVDCVCCVCVCCVWCECVCVCCLCGMCVSVCVWCVCVCCLCGMCVVYVVCVWCVCVCYLGCVCGV